MNFWNREEVQFIKKGACARTVNALFISPVRHTARRESSLLIRGVSNTPWRSGRCGRGVEERPFSTWWLCMHDKCMCVCVEAWERVAWSQRRSFHDVVFICIGQWHRWWVCAGVRGAPARLHCALCDECAC